jgi:serine/threonine protein kinase
MSELFAGKYQLKRRLGVGGMAEVWLAELRGPQGFTRQLVIKRILPHLADDDNFITMFEDEARLAAHLSHPHAVRVEEFARDGDVWYLAMEYLDGGDLRNLTRRARTINERVPLQVLLQMGGDIASALYHAHTLRGADQQPLNLIHRDVSPHNILVTTQGQAKLVDFGIARAETNQVKTRTGMVKGKSGYMSPEQALGRTLDGRSDQFALAIVLYETALQVRIFQGENDLAIMRKVVACEIPTLISMDPQQSIELSDVLERALQRAPEDRFPDCDAFAAALFNCLDTTGLRGGHQPVADWVKRMDALEGPFDKLVGLDALRKESTGLEEVTRISRSRSAMHSTMASRRNQAAAGQFEPRPNTAKRNEASQAAWPLALALGLLVLGAGAFWLSSSATEQSPTPPRTIEPVPSPNTGAADTQAPTPRVKPSAPPQQQPRVAAKPKTKPKVNTRPRTKSEPRPTPTPVVANPISVKIKLKRSAVFGYGDIYVDGRRRATDQPVATLRLQPGKHTFCIYNKGGQRGWKRTLTIPRDQPQLLGINLEMADPTLKCP